MKGNDTMYKFWFAVEDTTKASSLRRSVEKQNIKVTWFPSGVKKSQKSRPFENLTVALSDSTRRDEVDALFYESLHAPLPADGVLYRVPTVISIDDLDVASLRPFSFHRFKTAGRRVLGFGRGTDKSHDALRAAKQAAGFVVWSEWAKAELVKALQIPSDKVLVARTGVDLVAWDKAIEDYNLALSRQPGQLPALVRLLFVGDDFTGLGGDLLLDILQNNPELTARCEVHFIVNRATAAAYSDLTARIPNLYFHTYLHRSEEPSELYLKADVLVVPARKPISPSLVAKALAAGLPVVASRIEGLTELIKHGENGLLVEPNNQLELIEALTQLVDDPEQRSQLGNGARKTAEEEFDAAVNSAKIIEFLKERVIEASATTILRSMGRVHASRWHIGATALFTDPYP